MTTIETTQGVRAVPSVDVAGVPWPAYKVHALLVALVVAAAVLTVTRSPELTVWVTTASATVSWWGLRLAHLRA
ncbi:MAG: hypothetical protein INR72_04395 [Williamsia herbipolensis]|jgi:hypothetical protein|uniref:Uncharacterized protein n=1 Tax=Williamsia serinedens TaxID=391736 RepID=A0ABT1H9A6_9NOCA|nr:hypothetical protein [Williamsia serinedens]MBE7160465.1 hypothetical protein [Williamsia herbipolensis]MCP2162502.1 hypothetical protein [Williamsia serinedens]